MHVLNELSRRVAVAQLCCERMVTCRPSKCLIWQPHWIPRVLSSYSRVGLGQHEPRLQLLRTHPSPLLDLNHALGRDLERESKQCLLDETSERTNAKPV